MNEREIRETIASTECSVRECYSTWGESYYKDYYESQGAYPPIHTNIVRDELCGEEILSIIDAGCGPASMLRDLDGLGFDRFGFDLTDEMVIEARKVMVSQGVPESQIWKGSVLDPASFRSQGKGYCAAICFGVLPHIPVQLDKAVLTNLAKSIRPGGTVMVEARNQLFALFSLNRYSRDFFREILIDERALRNDCHPTEIDGFDAALKNIDEHFRIDLPPIRRGKEGEPGYDEVLSRTHNPFELQKIAEEAGLERVEILFYHYHALPPIFEHLLPATFRKRSLGMESPRDWRGNFLASAFILRGTKSIK